MNESLEASVLAGLGGGAKSGLTEGRELGDFDGLAGACGRHEEVLLLGEGRGWGGAAGGEGFGQGDLVGVRGVGGSRG